MKRFGWSALILGMMALVSLLALWADVGDSTQPKPPSGKKKITDLLEPIRVKHKVPALAAAVVTSKGLVAVGAVGVRKNGSNVVVTIFDLFHLGSDTKAMLAALIARLVELGRVTYHTPLEKIFPELAKTMTPEVRKITLTHLLSHHAGFPPNLEGGWGKVPRVGTGREQRLVALKMAFANKLDHKPGTKFQYSNLGYTVAGAVAERVADAEWEDLMKQHLFAPLKITHYGYGAMGSAEKIDQPWQHNKDGKPVAPGPFADNPPVMGPAGRVHISLQDWAKFIADQLRGGRGGKGLLQHDSYLKMHSIPFKDSNYTLGGWGRTEVQGGYVLRHDGSNTRNYATAIVSTAKDLAVLVVCNQGHEEATKACAEGREALFKLYQSK